jgi:hypothetical protein
MAKRSQTKRRKKAGEKTAASTNYHDEMEKLLRERKRQTNTKLKMKAKK